MANFGKIITNNTKGENLPSKSWTVTDWDVRKIRQTFWKDLDKTRMAMGQEICPKTQKPHLQIYITFTRAYRWTALKKLLGDNCYFEKAVQSDWNYCLKEMNYYKEDNRKQGKRNDLIRLKRLVVEKGVYAVADECNGNQLRTLELYLQYKEKPRDWKTTVLWFWGPPGTGKTMKAKKIAKGKRTYIKNSSSKWFNGYDAHECVIFDDFRDHWFPYSDTLALLDRYEKRVETKGSMRQFKPRLLIITSSYKPSECYMRDQSNGDNIGQLLRRIDVITQFHVQETKASSGLEPKVTTPFGQPTFLPQNIQ